MALCFGERPRPNTVVADHSSCLVHVSTRLSAPKTHTETHTTLPALSQVNYSPHRPVRGLLLLGNMGLGNMGLVKGARFGSRIATIAIILACCFSCDARIAENDTELPRIGNELPTELPYQIGHDGDICIYIYIHERLRG